MSQSRDARDMGKTVYRMMIGMYPAPFRQEHGRDMLDLYDDLHIDCAGKQVRLWRLLITDWCAAIIDQHIQNGVLRMKSSMMMKGMATVLLVVGVLGLLYVGGGTAFGLYLHHISDGGNSITYEWETYSEIDNAGFNIRRSRLPIPLYDPLESMIGNDCTVPANAERINATMIPSQGASGSYSYKDTTIEAGMTYCYQVEAIDTAGVVTTFPTGMLAIAHPFFAGGMIPFLLGVIAVSAMLIYGSTRVWRKALDFPTGKIVSS